MLSIFFFFIFSFKIPKIWTFLCWKKKRSQQTFFFSVFMDKWLRKISKWRTPATVLMYVQMIDNYNFGQSKLLLLLLLLLFLFCLWIHLDSIQDGHFIQVVHHVVQVQHHHLVLVVLLRLQRLRLQMVINHYVMKN